MAKIKISMGKWELPALGSSSSHEVGEVEERTVPILSLSRNGMLRWLSTRKGEVRVQDTS